MGKVLNQVQVDAFARDGYVCPIDGISSERAGSLSQRIEAYEREHGVSATQALRIKGHLAFPFLTDLCRDPAILDAVEDVLGPDILITMSTFWFKGAGDGTFVS